MKRVSSLEVICTLLIMVFIAFQPPMAIGSDNQPSRLTYGFDDDGDGLDDRIYESTDFPLSVFLHPIPGKFQQALDSVEDIEGISILKTYDMIEPFSAIVENRVSMKRAIQLHEVAAVEMQTEAVSYGNKESKAVKAAPSTEYSPQTSHELGFLGEGISIAILDSGVDNEHPSLTGSFVAGADFTLPDPPLSSRNGTTDPDDRMGHGTAVASVCLGRGEESGMGIAPKAGLIDLKVSSRIPDQIQSSSSNVIEALQWCRDNKDRAWEDSPGYDGVDLILLPMSVGPENGAVSQAIEETIASGIPVIIPSGNTGTSYSNQDQTTWPDGTIVIGGTDDKGTVTRGDDTYWSGSTWGPRSDDGDSNQYDEMKPDLSAPAVNISFASFSDFSRVQAASGLSSGTGTSYSAAIGAGLVALVLESNPDLSDSGDPTTLRRILHMGSEPAGEKYDELISEKYNVHYGFGMADAYRSIREGRRFNDANHRPEIVYLNAEPEKTPMDSPVKITVKAKDIDEDPLDYDISFDEGSVTGSGPTWNWQPPNDPGTYSIKVTVTDDSGGSDSGTLPIEVTEEGSNNPPDITSFRAKREVLGLGESTELTVVVLDADGDDLSFSYSANMGSVTGDDETSDYTAPLESGMDTVKVEVTDTKGARDTASINIEITEGSENRAPSITLVSVSPTMITPTSENATAVLRANVYDPDGLDDISMVTCDLTQLNIKGEYQLFDDGEGVDETANDGQYSFLIEGLDLVDPGIYVINVTAVDSFGASSTQGTTLELLGEGDGNYTKGRSRSIDTFLWITVGGIVILIIAILAILVLVNRSSGRRGGTRRPMEGQGYNYGRKTPIIQGRSPYGYPPRR